MDQVHIRESLEFSTIKERIFYIVDLMRKAKIKMFYWFHFLLYYGIASSENAYDVFLLNKINSRQ